VEHLTLVLGHIGERIEKPTSILMGTCATAPVRIARDRRALALLTWCGASTVQLSSIAILVSASQTRSIALLSFSSRPWVLTKGSRHTTSMPRFLTVARSWLSSLPVCSALVGDFSISFNPLRAVRKSHPFSSSYLTP